LKFYYACNLSDIGDIGCVEVARNDYHEAMEMKFGILTVPGDEGFLLGSVDAYGRLVVTSLNSDIQGTTVERIPFFPFPFSTIPTLALVYKMELICVGFPIPWVEESSIYSGSVIHLQCR